MQPNLISPAVAKAVLLDDLAKASAARRAQRVAEAPASPLEVTIRFARADETEELDRLGQLDGRGRGFALGSDVLVAEVGGRLAAAWSMARGVAISDPFRASQPLVGLLEVRAQQIDRARSGHRRRRNALSRLIPHVS